MTRNMSAAYTHLRLSINSDVIGFKLAGVRTGESICVRELRNFLSVGAATEGALCLTISSSSCDGYGALKHKKLLKTRSNSHGLILWKSLYAHYYAVFLVQWEHHNYVLHPRPWNNSSLLIWKSYYTLHKHLGRVVKLVLPEGEQNFKYYLIKREVYAKITYCWMCTS